MKSLKCDERKYFFKMAAYKIGDKKNLKALIGATLRSCILWTEYY
jgi:hypothetical protein